MKKKTIIESLIAFVIAGSLIFYYQSKVEELRREVNKSRETLEDTRKILDDAIEKFEKNCPKGEKKYLKTNKSIILKAGSKMENVFILYTGNSSPIMVEEKDWSNTNIHLHIYSAGKITKFVTVM